MSGTPPPKKRVHEGPHTPVKRLAEDRVPNQHLITPTRAAVIAIYDFNKQHNLPVSERAVEAYTGVPKSTVYDILTTEQHRRLNNDPYQTETRGRKPAISSKQNRRYGKLNSDWRS